MLLELLNVVVEGWTYRRSDDPEERAKAARSIGWSLVILVPLLLIAGYYIFQWVAHTLARDGY